MYTMNQAEFLAFCRVCACDRATSSDLGSLLLQDAAITRTPLNEARLCTIFAHCQQDEDYGLRFLFIRSALTRCCSFAGDYNPEMALEVRVSLRAVPFLPI